MLILVFQKEKRKVDVSFNQLIDLNFLPSFPKIKVLKALYNKITNLDGIESCEQLEECNLIGNSLVEVDKLVYCKKLHTLSLDGNKIDLFPSMTNLKNLVHLTIENNCLTNFEGICGLENLQSLSIARNNIEKLTTLGKCRFRTSLTELDMSNNNIYSADFACLQMFEKLEVSRVFIYANPSDFENESLWI